MKEEIIKWLNSERVFLDGAIIYYKYGKVKNLKQNFLFITPSKRLMESLLYELCKLAELSKDECAAVKKNIRLPLPESGPARS